MELGQHVIENRVYLTTLIAEMWYHFLESSDLSWGLWVSAPAFSIFRPHGFLVASSCFLSSSLTHSSGQDVGVTSIQNGHGGASVQFTARGAEFDLVAGQLYIPPKRLGFIAGPVL